MALRRRERAPEEDAQRAKCSAKSTLWRANLALSVLALAMFFALSMLSSCVSTAECDQSSPCGSEDQVCFDYICRTICTNDDECGEELACVSCELENSCYGRTESACVDADGGYSDY